MTNLKSAMRPPHLCRSWMFVGGADEEALADAPASGADVLIQELEDFTPPGMLPKAHALSRELYDSWREAGAVAAVRVNPLGGEGMDDLAAVMRGKPDIVALPKVSSPQDIVELDGAVARFEREYGLEQRSTLLLPNIEFAAGLVRTIEIARSSTRIAGCLLASEDLAADLGAERGRDGFELSYARQRFIVECTAAQTIAIDCPYTWSDEEGVEKDALWARRLGYRAKSAVAHSHAMVINNVLTPSPEDVARAELIVVEFERAQAQGAGRVEIDGVLVETPIYLTAKRLIERARELAKVNRN
ncbi:MAG: HpcH/HpaI aldolase/citrate lyase family protein [Hyphomicrobiales bacterium]